MISDVLSEAVEEMDNYLNNKFYDRMYDGSLRDAVVDLRSRMQAMRIYLDTVPDVFESPEKMAKQDAHWKKVFSADEYTAITELLAKVEATGVAGQFYNKQGDFSRDNFQPELPVTKRNDRVRPAISSSKQK